MTKQIEYIKCTKCVDKWQNEIKSCDANNDNYEKHFTTDLREYNDGYIFNGVFAIKGMIDKNINHTNKCRICKSTISSNSITGGNNFRYHDKCFFGYYGHLD